MNAPVEMLALLSFDLMFGGGILMLIFGAFSIWMLIDAIRRDEMLWALFILLFPVINAPLYFFLVYRGGGGFTTRGFELPGAHDRARIKALQDQIHHLDKAHHHAQLGDIYFQQGKLAKAEESYKAAMQRDPDDLDTRAHYGQCLLRLKRPQEALLLLESVRAQNPKHDYSHTLMALAETYTQLGEREKALAAWGEVLQSNSYARARVQLAELYLAQSLRDQARPILEEVISDQGHAPAFQRSREKIWLRKARQLLKQCQT